MTKPHKTVEDYERDFAQAYADIQAGGTFGRTLWSEALGHVIHYRLLIGLREDIATRTSLRILCAIAFQRLESVWECPGCMAAEECSIHGKAGEWVSWMQEKHGQLMEEAVYYCQQCDEELPFYEKEPGELVCRVCQSYPPCDGCEGQGYLIEEDGEVECSMCRGSGQAHGPYHE